MERAATPRATVSFARGAGLALALACSGLSGAARAEQAIYQVLAGSLADLSSGEVRRLQGGFLVNPDRPETPSAPDVRILRVEDFLLTAGGREFAPAAPLEPGDALPLAPVQIADQIQIDGTDVSLLHLRAGGERVAVSSFHTTWRFYEFRARAGSAAGSLAGDGLPRRIEILGSLYEVLQSVPRSEDCEPRIVAPPPGGGGVIISTPGASLELRAVPSPLVERPDASLALRGVLRPDRVAGAAALGAPSPSEAGSATAATARAELVLLAGGEDDAAPSLSELGITAPSGASVEREGGVVHVRTEGDLFVHDALLDGLPIAQLSLVAGGRLVVEGSIVLPEGATLSLVAGSAIELDEAADVPEADARACAVPRLVTALGRRERELGAYRLVASAARPVVLDVLPRQRHNRVRPGSRQRLTVAVAGSERFDVRDLDEGSLRLGGAPLQTGRPGRGVSLRDLDRDGHLDLLARFAAYETDVSWGDATLCLTGTLRNGTTIEGCDFVDTSPPGYRPRSRRLR